MSFFMWGQNTPLEADFVLGSAFTIAIGGPVACTGRLIQQSSDLQLTEHLSIHNSHWLVQNMHRQTESTAIARLMKCHAIDSGGQSPIRFKDIGEHINLQMESILTSDLGTIRNTSRCEVRVPVPATLASR